MKCEACDGSGDCQQCDGSGDCTTCNGDGYLSTDIAEGIINAGDDLDRARLFEKLRASWCLECGRPAPCFTHQEKT